MAAARLRNTRAPESDNDVRLEGDLTLEDAVKLALVHNRAIQVRLQDKDIARGVVTEAYSNVLPSVTGTADYTRVDKQAFGTTSNLNRYSAALTVRQPLFRGGAIPAALRAARLTAHLADESVRATVQDVIRGVAQSYYDTLLALKLFDVNREAVLSAEGQLGEVKAKHAEGAASEYDVLRAEVEVSNFKADMIAQQDRIHQARTRLLRTLGVATDSDVSLTGDLPYTPIRPDAGAAVEIAQLNRPDLYLAELQVRLQAEALRIARSGYWPSSLSGSMCPQAEPQAATSPG